jgi:4-nitrophenyl phosphatase
VRFLTNNSTRTRDYFADKLCRMGIAATPEEMYNSGFGAGRHLVEVGHRRTFVVGEPGLVQTLREAGVQVVEEERVDAVVSGLCRSFSYDLMNAAMQRILLGAEYVATNRDATYPIEGGRFTPGAGSIAAAISTCSGVEPFVVGKPNPYLVRLAMEEAGLSPEEVLAVGDRLDTDIESGRRAGCDTFLVLTGVEQVAPEGQQHGATLRSLL